MKLLDLYCKAGGAAQGYYEAGYDEIVGVDIEPQTNYPFNFIQMDAIEYLKAQDLSQFDLIHASPPCQAYSSANGLYNARNSNSKKPRKIYPKLIEPTRELLLKSGKPYVIENVYGARKELINPIILCGCMFPELKVYRKRCFESNIHIDQLKHYPHNDSTPSAGNGISPKGYISVCGTGGVKGMNSKEILAYWSYAMGINWMTRDELREAIPPAFTKYIGEQIIKILA